MSNSDTIVAVATPPGVGGIAVVRLSGCDALVIAASHLTLNTDHSTLTTQYFTRAPRRAVYCRFDDLDDGIAVYYPVGYTGQPTVEFSCHGSLYVQQAIVQALIDSGARMAQAGEFTLRAFLNGRLNLAQAEAVADLIDAVTPTQHRLAVSQLRGGYARMLRDLRQQLVDLTALLELELDFSQEDVEFADRRELNSLLARLVALVSGLVDSFSLGNALKRGIPVAIVGKPNVGKSSLLNALLAEDRAIVSAVPGTTRDTIEETLNIEGVSFRFIDTAGLRETSDSVEQLGIERSRRAIEEAQVVVQVVDCRDGALPAGCRPNTIVVYNKCDLLAADAQPMPEAVPTEAGVVAAVRVSALTGQGVDALKQAIRRAVGLHLASPDEPLLTNVRHYEAMKRILAALGEVQRGLDAGLATDLVAVDLRDALYHLGTITGEVSSTEVLDSVFSRFCIGK